jgi:hypothetical protein
MAEIYEVYNCWSLNSRNKPGMHGTPVKWYQKGDQVKVYEKSGNWYNTSDTKDWWCYNKYLKLIKSDPPPAPPPAPAPVVKDVTPVTRENKDDADMSSVPVSRDLSGYSKVLKKYINAFGSPPKYTEKVDPYYDSSNFKVGRAMMETWYSHPAIFSICPGTVDYLPGFSTKDKDDFWDSVSKVLSGDVKTLASEDRNLDINGKLYAFKSAFKDYSNVVNLLARVSANYLGIGNVSNMVDGTKVPFNKFDYGYYTNSGGSATASSIFSQTVNSIINSTVADYTYVHFFVNHSGASVNENISTSAGESELENALNQSKLSSIQQNIQFLFGGAIGDSAQSDVDAIIADMNKNTPLVGSFATMAKNYLKGGRLVFPKMITGVGYDKSINVQLQFTSVYGDRRSVFKYTILPAIHLLALATPKQLTDNMYTYPFLCRVYQKGLLNSELAYISNLEFHRGGSDDTCWTVDNLPTEITATFTVTPLYSNLMVTSAKNPYLAMHNTALMEYLATLCGLDLMANNLEVKLSNAMKLIENRITDIPTDFAKSVPDLFLVNEWEKFKKVTS